MSVRVVIRPHDAGRRWTLKQPPEVTFTDAAGKVFDPIVCRTALPEEGNGVLSITLVWIIPYPGPKMEIRVAPILFQDGGKSEEYRCPLDVPPPGRGERF